MLDIRYIRENQDEVRRSIERRGARADLNRWLTLDARRSELIPEVEAHRSKLNVKGKPTAEQLAALQANKQVLSKLEEELAYVEQEWTSILEEIPNRIADDTPDGGEESNRDERHVGKIPDFDFPAKDHLELNETLHYMDFTRGTKVAGARFYFLRDKGARLWDAVVILTKRIIREHGFEILYVPEMVNGRVAKGTGFLPRGEESQIYQIDGEDLNLIATAELPLTGMHMDDVLDLTKPLRYAAVSTCYRKEAGTYGKFSKGLYRVHQFDKLEMYTFCRPDESEARLDDILALEEAINQALGIPYRVTRTAAGDMSAPAFRKYDTEYWSPQDKTWRELTSCSNCTDFQARRLNIRYRNADGKLDYAHSLNGTAVTSSRTLVAIIENYQTADGQVKLPPALAEIYGGEYL